MIFMPLKQRELTTLVKAALAEDIGRGDMTSLSCLEPNAIKAEIVAKSEGILSGLNPALLSFYIVDSANIVTPIKSEIQASLKDNSTLWFLHGFAVHFGFIKPASNCDVILIAPHAPGLAVRDEYLGSKSLSAFFAVYQNATGKADKSVFKLSSAMGFKKSKLLKTTFKDEALGDLFGEQAVLCGGMAGLIKNGFEVLVENGIPPENAYLEVAYQLDLIIALIKKHGIEGMFERISVAARFGSLEAGPEIVGESVKKKMRSRYKEIESGKFARKLNNLSRAELDSLSKDLKKLSSPLFEKMARKFSN